MGLWQKGHSLESADMERSEERKSMTNNRRSIKYGQDAPPTGHFSD